MAAYLPNGSDNERSGGESYGMSVTALPPGGTLVQLLAECSYYCVYPPVIACPWLQLHDSQVPAEFATLHCPYTATPRLYGRPQIPILAISANARTCRELNLVWGVRSILVTDSSYKNTYIEQRTEIAVRQMFNMGLAQVHIGKQSTELVIIWWRMKSNQSDYVILMPTC